MGDAELVAAAQAGDEEAFLGLVRRYQGALLAAARQMTAQVADAEDVAQEAVLQAFRHLHALREREKFRAWLFSILRRQCSLSSGKNGMANSHWTRAMALNKTQLNGAIHRKVQWTTR